MKKTFVLFALSTLILSSIPALANHGDKNSNYVNVSSVTGVSKKKKSNDIIKDPEYKQIKKAYFNAEGYGDVYNCWVEKQRWCKVKDLDTGLYVLCDREVSRTQMESAKTFYKLGRCVKLN